MVKWFHIMLMVNKNQIFLANLHKNQILLGELCIRGYNIMKEYWDEPIKTAETIDSSGWLKTGDICSMVN